MYVTLADRRRVTVASYTRAWKSAKADPARTWYDGPADDVPTERTAAEVLRQFRAALDDRINRRGGLVVSRRRCYPRDMVQPISRTPCGGQFVVHLVAREGRRGMDEREANEEYLGYRDYEAHEETFGWLVAGNVERGMLLRRADGEGGHRLFATRRGRREYRRSRRIHAVRPG